MITCTNGINTFCVTEGAFESIFKDQGYKNVKEESAPVVTENTEVVTENTEEDLLLEKPISEWTKQEVKRFAAENDIDISGTRNVAQAKEIIKQFLERE